MKRAGKGRKDAKFIQFVNAWIFINGQGMPAPQARKKAEAQWSTIFRKNSKATEDLIRTAQLMQSTSSMKGDKKPVVTTTMLALCEDDDEDILHLARQGIYSPMTSSMATSQSSTPSHASYATSATFSERPSIDYKLAAPSADFEPVSPGATAMRPVPTGVSVHRPALSPSNRGNGSTIGDHTPRTDPTTPATAPPAVNKPPSSRNHDYHEQKEPSSAGSKMRSSSLTPSDLENVPLNPRMIGNGKLNEHQVQLSNTVSPKNKMKTKAPSPPVVNPKKGFWCC